MGDHSEARRFDESENEDFDKLTKIQLQNAFFDLKKEFKFYKDLSNIHENIQMIDWEIN